MRTFGLGEINIVVNTIGNKLCWSLHLVVKVMCGTMSGILSQAVEAPCMTDMDVRLRQLRD